MKHAFPLSCFFISLFSFINAQPILFQNGYGGIADDMFKKAIATSSGDIVAVGSTKSFGAGNWDILLTKLDTAGELLWTKTLGTTGMELGNHIASASDGGYIIAGTTNGFAMNNDDDALVVKTDSLGNVQWAITYGDTFPDVARFVKETNDGNYLIAGTIQSLLPNTYWDNMLLLKINTNGNMLWGKHMGNQYSDAYDLAELPTGDIIIAGAQINSYTPGNVDMDGDLIRMSPSGNLLWQKHYGGTKDDGLYSCVFSGNNFLFAAGVTENFGAGGADIYVVQSDITGVLINSFTYGTSGNDYAYDIIQTPDSNYLIAGTTDYFSGNFSPLLLKINSSGALLWSKTLGSTSTDIIYSGDVTNNNQLILSGYSNGMSGNGDMSGYLLKLDSTGSSDCPFSSIQIDTSSNNIKFNLSLNFDSLSFLPVFRTLSVSSPLLDLYNSCGTNIHESEFNTNFNIYPNPCNGNFSLLSENNIQGKCELEIIDINGKIVKQTHISNTSSSYHNVSELQNGLFFCRVLKDDKYIWSTKLSIVK